MFAIVVPHCYRVVGVCMILPNCHITWKVYIKVVIACL
uniref:Uncharacterized protein n=1 Tax=Arundo donax TaxID=35708 RepID=A0A0A8ZZE1_ARUDO